MSDTKDDEQAYAHLLRNERLTLRDLDLDAFADGVLACRAGKGFHENPHGTDALTVRRLSWSMGWNERALQQQAVAIAMARKELR